MAVFITRVELHDASATDYQNLHDYMSEAGFFRTITGDNGVSYMLPPAEYSWFGTASAEVIRNTAASAAQRTGKQYSILTSEANRLSWIGLTPFL